VLLRFLGPAQQKASAFRRPTIAGLIAIVTDEHCTGGVRHKKKRPQRRWSLPQGRGIGDARLAHQARRGMFPVSNDGAMTGTKSAPHVRFSNKRHRSRFASRHASVFTLRQSRHSPDL